MKFILLATLFTLGATTNRTVYVCNSKNAIAYHLVKDCRGLSACKSEIVRSTESAELEAGKKLCGWED